MPRIREYLAEQFGLDESQRLAWIRHWIGTGLSAVEQHLAGEAETGDDGAFVVPLPEAGDYTVTLDEDTLPDGVAIREGRSASVTLPVAVGQQRNVLFPLGEGSPCARALDAATSLDPRVAGVPSTKGTL